MENEVCFAVPRIMLTCFSYQTKRQRVNLPAKDKRFTVFVEAYESNLQLSTCQ
jgi:hypothetical protein